MSGIPEIFRALGNMSDDIYEEALNDLEKGAKHNEELYADNFTTVDITPKNKAPLFIKAACAAAAIIAVFVAVPVIISHFGNIPTTSGTSVSSGTVSSTEENSSTASSDNSSGQEPEKLPPTLDEVVGMSGEDALSALSAFRIGDICGIWKLDGAKQLSGGCGFWWLCGAKAVTVGIDNTSENFSDNKITYVSITNAAAGKNSDALFIDNLSKAADGSLTFGQLKDQIDELDKEHRITAILLTENGAEMLDDELHGKSVRTLEIHFKQNGRLILNILPKEKYCDLNAFDKNDFPSDDAEKTVYYGRYSPDPQHADTEIFCGSRFIIGHGGHSFICETNGDDKMILCGEKNKISVKNVGYIDIDGDGEYEVIISTGKDDPDSGDNLQIYLYKNSERTLYRLSSSDVGRSVLLTDGLSIYVSDSSLQRSHKLTADMFRSETKIEDIYVGIFKKEETLQTAKSDDRFLSAYYVYPNETDRMLSDDEVALLLQNAAAGCDRINAGEDLTKTKELFKKFKELEDEFIKITYPEGIGDVSENELDDWVIAREQPTLFKSMEELYELEKSIYTCYDMDSYEKFAKKFDFLKFENGTLYIKKKMCRYISAFESTSFAPMIPYGNYKWYPDTEVIYFPGITDMKAIFVMQTSRYLSTKYYIGIINIVSDDNGNCRIERSELDFSQTFAYS